MNFYSYYDRELAYMREMAGEFAQNYPEVASRLDLQRHQCDDPHVERLIEAFCFIAARIHQRLDSEFPEISQALLSLIFPGCLRPVPALSVAQLRVDPEQSPPTEAIAIRAGEPISLGDSCEFRTCYPVDLWPISIDHAELLDPSDFPAWAPRTNVSAGVLLRLSAADSFTKLKGFGHLRFCLRGSGHAPYTFYEYFLNHVSCVLIRDPAAPKQESFRLAAERITPVGFEENESLFASDGTGFLGFRLLQEFLAFPEKFLFFDLAGLSILSQKHFSKHAEILFLLDRNCPKDERFRRLQFSTSKDTFSLGCTPVVNLFRKMAEPIRVDHRKSEYAVRPDLYKSEEMEVFSIDSVTGRAFGTKVHRSYKPMFSFQHTPDAKTLQQTFWCATRRHSSRTDDEGTELFLSLVDLAIEPAHIADETLLVETTCTNRDLPSQIDFSVDFEDEARLRDSRVQWRFLQRPSKSLRPPLDHRLDWRLISLLGVNYLGVSEGPESLKEILSLLNFSDAPAVRDRIGAIRTLRSAPSRARVRMKRAGEVVPVYCHGLSLTIDFDQEALSATGPFLFAAVLERFLAQYASLNSFTQLEATTQKGTKVLKEWQPRAGNQVLL